MSCFNQDAIRNIWQQAEQKHDREQIEETTLQRISREAAEEILTQVGHYARLHVNEIASIIYTHFRNGKIKFQ